MTNSLEKPLRDKIKKNIVQKSQNLIINYVLKTSLPFLGCPGWEGAVPPIFGQNRALDRGGAQSGQNAAQGHPLGA